MGELTAKATKLSTAEAGASETAIVVDTYALSVSVFGHNRWKTGQIPHKDIYFAPTISEGGDPMLTTPFPGFEWGVIIEGGVNKSP